MSKLLEHYRAVFGLVILANGIHLLVLAVFDLRDGHPAAWPMLFMAGWSFIVAPLELHAWYCGRMYVE